MKILLAPLALALWCTPLIAQTVTTQPVVVTTTPANVPAQNITITTPRFGGKVMFTIPAQTLAPLTATVPAQTAPVSLSGLTGSFTCKLGADSTVIVNPDGTKTITGVTCSVVTK